VRIIKLTPLLLSALLLGCNATNQTRPESASDEAPQTQQVRDGARAEASGGQSASEDRSRPEQQPPAAPTISSQSQFDQLSGRLTLIQEQMLQLRSDNQRLQEQNQMVLNRLQLISSSTAATSEVDVESEASGTAANGSEQLDMAIGQLMQVLNSLDNTGSSDGEYALGTTYTRNGDWILLRYHRLNGSTWLADRGEWRPLEEQQAPSQGDYKVLLHRADQDRKGYVAVRIDRNTGSTWWLNDTRWQEYISD
jgi:hypothetical protein